MIQKRLLEELLVVFPRNAEKIKEHAEKRENAELRALLLKSSGVYPFPRFTEEIEAFKEGRFGDILSIKERERRFSLTMMAVRAI